MTMDTQHFDVARYLANLPLFRRPPHKSCNAWPLVAACAALAGEAIFRVGMPCEEFHVTVLNGQTVCHLTRRARKGD